ncbi:hypothetical protein TNCV_3845191 [Trichonephila clavipes]|nr:hypothetical protein TNCV_3845191 [Trichonephila clavipes]
MLLTVVEGHTEWHTGSPLSPMSNIREDRYIVNSTLRINKIALFSIDPRSLARVVLYTPATRKVSYDSKKIAQNHDFSVAAHFRSLNLQARCNQSR